MKNALKNYLYTLIVAALIIAALRFSGWEAYRGLEFTHQVLVIIAIVFVVDISLFLVRKFVLKKSK